MFLAFILGIVNAMLINNVTLSRFYGICPFLGVSKKPTSALGMGVAVIFVIVLSAAVTWPIYNYILVPANIAFMDTLVYILVIASLVQLVEMFIKKFSPALYNALGVYLPLITTNCAVLGVAQENTNNAYDFLTSMGNALGTSVGFALVIFVFSTIRIKLDAMDIPKAFKGIPIALVVAASMAIAFMGIQGMISQ